MMKKAVRNGFFVLVLVLCCVTAVSQKAEAKKKTYTITTKTKPCNSSYTKATTYNSKTKHYYLLKSYLEKLEKNGGGTLVLKKGTYKVCSTLYIPSNVTIKLRSGVNVRKTDTTGTKKLKATKYLFQLTTKKKAKKKTVTAYKSSRNVSIIGSGTATISMNKVKQAIGISMAHNSNVTIQKVRFKNRYGGSYIAVSGAKNVIIDSCKFYDGKFLNGSDYYYDIRLEVANKTIDSFGFSWSKLDNTANTNIYIKNNYFTGMSGAIGSTKYAYPTIKKKATVLYQENIRITDNKFRNISGTAIQGMAWKNTIISGNNFYRADKKSKTPYGISLAGSVNPTIKTNKFNYISTPIRFPLAKNSGKGKAFATVYNSVTSTQISLIENNTVTNADHYYVPYENGTTKRLTYFVNKSENNLVITPMSLPYREKYTDYASYEANTKDYFQFRAAMEQLETTGGGTLTVKAGIYNISNAVHIPSNVTIQFENGVVINKVAAKYTTSLTTPKAVFVMVAPSLASTSKSVSGYNGTQNVIMKGNGSVTIDCAFQNPGMAIVMGHTKNVTISGISFKRQLGYHFIELNSSQNTVVENCSFIDFEAIEKESTGADMEYKEAINIDGTDYNTNGFNYDWSAHDKTTCKDIIIRNNVFNNIGAAVGSHTYSVDNTTQLYHENIKIYQNTVKQTLHNAIRALNWRNPEIYNNTFENIAYDEDSKTFKANRAAILLRGVVNPTVKNNTIRNSYYVIAVQKIESSKPEGAGYEDTISTFTRKNWEDLLTNITYNCTKRVVHFKDWENFDLEIDQIPEDYRSMKFVIGDKEEPEETEKPVVTPEPSKSPVPSKTPETTLEPTATPVETTSPTETPIQTETPAQSESPVPTETTLSVSA